jgi:hypothetical protein
MYNGQLELSLGKARGGRSVSARQRRISRAQWWFQRMRDVVDRAVDWQPAPVPRPEQIWFPATSPEFPGKAQTLTAAARASRQDERHICE